MAEDEGCPIESNIKSTAGNYNDDDNNYNDDEFADEFADEFDDEFDDEFGDAIIKDEDDWGSVHSSNDGQNVIPINIQLQNGGDNDNKPIIGINDENPYGEGNEVKIRNGGKPQISVGDPKQKCWICDVCNAINNLLESATKYGFRCCVCSYQYHPNVAIIYSNDWDGVNENNPNEQIYTVWNCPFCTLKNDINWNKCDGCECNKPPSDQTEISYTYIKPKKLNGPNIHKQNNQNKEWVNNNNININNKEIKKKNKNKNNNNNNNKNIVRQPRIGNIGVARGIDGYPAKSILDNKCEKRLCDIFGKPYRNRLLCRDLKNAWTINSDLAHSRIEWGSYSNDAKKFVTEEIVGRGFAINGINGWIATMSINYIWIFEPNGCCGYNLIARYNFTEEQKLNGEDVQNSRIRFINNSIFVWSFARSRVYSFKLSYNSIILVDVIRDKYFKDSQTMDVAITNNLLILLFDRWCGVYKLFPKFEWYHAVAFATKPVNCFSFEICHFDEEYDDKHQISEDNKAFFSDSSDYNKKKKEKKQKRNIFRKSQKINYDEKKENDDNYDNDSFYKRSNKNYLFINTENQLIGIHPTNPTFDFLHIAKNALHGKCKYCISKKYGLFYISNDGKYLYQSSHLEYQSNQMIINLDNSSYLTDKFYPIEQFHDLMLRKGIFKFINLNFDETYGISGRLLLFCETQKKEYILHQIFNHNELIPFSDELNRIEYYLMPGMMKKPFNLIIFVYQFLFGDDLIDTLIQSPYFNPSLLRLKKQQEKELENIQKMQQQQQQQQINNNNNNDDDDDDDDDDDNMDIEYEKEGVM